MKRKNTLLLLAIILLFSLSCSLFSQLGGAADVEEVIPAETKVAEDAVPEATAEVDETADNSCNNILYPLVEGSQLIYKNYTEEGDTQIGMTVSSVADSQATIDMLDISTGIISQSTVECDAGAIKSYPLATLDTIFGDMAEGEMRMDYVSGFIAPAEETLEANNWAMDWQSQYVMNGEMTFTDEGETMTVLINESPVLMDWRIESTGQSLTVPAGTFNNVVVVKRDMEMTVSIDMGGFALDSNLKLESTHWFEPHVGMLKMNVDTVTAEFQGMVFPIASNQVMELIEIRPAK